MAEFDYDVLVIGAGPGGYVAAIRAAQLGLKTACAESRETLGGTCLNVGCIPSKAMLHASELYDDAANGMLAKLGVKIDAMSLDLPTMQGQRVDAVKGLTGGIEFLFKKNKVTWLKGLASFTGANTVDVAGEKVTAKNIVIATGSSVTPLPGVTVDNAGGKIVDSTGALELDKVPGHLVVVGGGVIGLELGSVWSRLGSEVTVLEAMDSFLPMVDQAVAKETQKLLGKQGLDIKLGARVTGSEVKDNEVVVKYTDSKGEQEQTFDKVIVCVGRRPYTQGVLSDDAGVKLDERGFIFVDDQCRTSVPGVYAIGDCVRGPMLAHKASEEGVMVADIIAGHKAEMNYDAIPSVVYTWPEAASVGRTEEKLKEAGVDYSKGSFPFMANSRARANGDTDGFVKILADAATDEVIGVHIIGPDAGTLIAELALAMEFGASSEDIARTCHAHPTLNEAVKEAALSVEGSPIHI